MNEVCVTGLSVGRTDQHRNCMSSFYHRAILSSAYALLFALVRSVTYALLFAVVRPVMYSLLFAVVRPVTYALLFALVRSVAYASALARSAILSIPFVRYAGVIATPDSWHIQKTVFAFSVCSFV